MAINERGIVVALLAWCSLAVAAPTEATADAYPRPDILQLAQAEGCPTGGKTSVVFYRYVGAGEAKAIERANAIPMTDANGNRKVVYFTDCFYTESLDAKAYLALPREPSFRVQFTLRGVKARCWQDVAPAYGEQGGGNECTLNSDSAPIAIPDPAAAIEPLQ